MNPTSPNPYQTTTWSTKELQVFYRTSMSGGKFLYDGVLWVIKPKRLAAGFWAISFIKDPSP